MPESTEHNGHKVGNQIYLITGGNRGIGLEFVKTLLAAANNTVISTVRSEQALDVLNDAAKSKSPSSILIPVILNVKSPESEYQEVIAQITSKHAIKNIDVVVANAGFSPGYAPVSSTSSEDVLEAFTTNTLGPLKLFQATKALLDVSVVPKFIVISSILSSIELADAIPNLSYGLSKAGANYMVRKVHMEEPRIIALSLHPGWVRTDMGEGYKAAIGYTGDVPLTPEESVRGMLQQIKTASKDSISGKLIDYEGKELPW